MQEFMKKNTNEFRGRSVTVKEYESITQAIRRFKKKVDNSGVLKDLREHEFYTPPSIAKKKAHAAAQARWNKKVRESAPKKSFH